MVVDELQVVRSERLFWQEGQIRIKYTIWSIARPQAERGNWVLRNYSQIINWSFLIRDTTKLFWVWIWVIGCSMSLIPIDIQ